IVREGAARLVEVSEEEIAEAMRMLYRSTHNVAEGAGAAAFAALMQERERQAGRKIGVILTGGNVDAEVFRSVLGG
ncbi:MAG: pyridoxal-phosphate dependent enzyme, partial [Gammaproteobacteria bacterium]|nr:pyridoxal-phosphate dependent enzyme [Gammaproteobacteria bacterium]